MPVAANVMIRPLSQPLPPSLGGTGKTSLNDAIVSMLPNQANNSGKVLGTDGSNIQWVSQSTSSGTVTSVNITSSTGIEVTGAPITTSGTFALSLSNTGVTAGSYTNPSVTVDRYGRVTAISSGSPSSSGVSTFNGRSGNVTLIQSDVASALTSPLPISSGGTGASTASDAISALLPSQANNSGKVLSTNGNSLSWTDLGAAGVSSFNTRTGAVALTQTDVTTALSSSTTSTITTTGSSNGSSIYLARYANYTGGTAGFVNSALFVDTTVGSNANRSQTSFEWGITSRINNHTDAGENVAIYGQGNRVSGNGPIWGMVAEATDLSNTSTTNSTSGTVGLEVDVWANGTDEFERRIGIDVVVGNAQQIRHGVSGIAKGHAYDGIRIGPQNNNITLGEFKYGVNILEGGGQTASFLSQANGTRGIWLKGNNSIGISLEGSYANSAIKIPENSSIAFDSANTVTMKFNSSNGYLEFFKGTVRHGFLDITNGADINLSTPGGSGGTSAITLTGDITGTGSGTVATQLSTTGVVSGAYGTASRVPVISVDTKGRITSASSLDISVDWTKITATPTTLAGYGITDAVSMSNNQLNLADASVSTSSTVVTIANPNQVIDQFPAAEFRSCKYIIQATGGANYQVGELMVIHNGTTAMITEFSGLTMGAALATFDADVISGNVRLLASPTQPDVVFRTVRTTIKI